jgi:hypothetical protein
MSAIGFGLTNLSESGQDLANSSSTRAATTAPAVTDLRDLVDVSTVPALSQVEPLQTRNPEQFQAVLTDAVRQLRAAAFQTTDPVEAAYLSSLANRFQRLELSGVPDLSASATAGS